MLTPLSVTSAVSEPRFRLFRAIGNCYCFLIPPSGRPYFSLGPDFPLSLCVLVMLLALLWIYHSLMSPYSSSLLSILGSISVYTLLLFYLLTAFTDPGIDLHSPDPTDSHCEACGSIVTPRTHHCVICDVCIRGYDHHCPLTGKCIGDGNVTCFYSFLTAIFVFFCYGALWTVTNQGEIEVK